MINRAAIHMIFISYFIFFSISFLFPLNASQKLDLTTVLIAFLKHFTFKDITSNIELNPRFFQVPSSETGSCKIGISFSEFFSFLSSSCLHTVNIIVDATCCCINIFETNRACVTHSWYNNSTKNVYSLQHPVIS